MVILGIVVAIIIAGALIGNPGAKNVVRRFFQVIGWIVLIGFVLVVFHHA